MNGDLSSWNYDPVANKWKLKAIDASGQEIIAANGFYVVMNVDEGKMVVGWHQINGYWYFFNSDGAMLRDTLTPDSYIVDKNGRWRQ